MKNRFFIAACIAALIIPNLIYPLVKSSIDSENHENRTYASFPELTVKNIDNIPDGVETYYEDRLPFKNQLVRINSSINSILSKYDSKYNQMQINDTVSTGIDNWLFYTISSDGEDALAEYFGYHTYSNEELAEISTKYQALSDQYAEQGIHFLFFIAPNKEQVYDNKLSESFPKGVDYSNNETNRAQQLIQYLNDNTNVDVLYPLFELRALRDEYQLYYKYDSHWNQLGSFVGAQTILNSLFNESVSLSDVDIKTDGFNVGDLANMLGMGSAFNDDPEYTISHYKSKVKATTKEASDDNTYIHYTSNLENGKTAIIVGDSFRFGLSIWLRKNFSELVVTDSYELAANYINQEKPDIIIFEVVERRQGAQESMPDYFLYN